MKVVSTKNYISYINKNANEDIIKVNLKIERFFRSVRGRKKVGKGFHLNLSKDMYCDAVRAPTELSIFTATISSIITVLSVIGNGIIIFVVIRDPLKNLRTPFNFFLVNLAFSDLIIGLITSPLSVYGHARESVGKLNEDIKIMFQLPYFVSITASILNLGVLCADRFTAIIYPMKHRIYMSLKNVFL